MAEQIIPRTDTPGAVDAGVPGFIDRMLAGYYQDKERNVVRAGLTQVATDAAGRGKPFAAAGIRRSGRADEDLRPGAVRPDPPQCGPANASPHFFRMIKELTIIGYCMSASRRDKG